MLQTNLVTCILEVKSKRDGTQIAKIREKETIFVQVCKIITKDCVSNWFRNVSLNEFVGLVLLIVEHAFCC